MCLVRGGRWREWRPAVRALRVAINTLAEDEMHKSIGDLSGHNLNAIAAKANECERPGALAQTSRSRSGDEQ
eukprot:6210723-Pleurochrysis_carterae.AAC.1